MTQQMPIEIVLKAVDRLSGPLAGIKRKLTNSLSPLQSLRFAQFPSTGLQQNLDLTRAFGFELKNLSRSIFQLGRRFLSLALIGGGALGGLMISTARYGEALGKTAKNLKVNAAQLQAWYYAAERSGVSQNNLKVGLERLNHQIVQALSGQQSAKRWFDLLGINLVDEKNKLKDLTTIFPEVAQAISQIKPELRQGISMELFGRKGADLVNFLEQGPDAIHAMGEELKHLYGILPDDFTEQAESLTDAWTNFKTVTKGLKDQLAYSFFPVIQEGLKQLTDWLSDNRKNLIASMQAIVQQIPQALNHIKSALLQLHTVLSPLAKGISWVINRLGGMKIIIAILASVIGSQLIKVLFSLIRLFALLALTVRANPILAALGLLITGLAFAVQQLIKHHQQLKDAWQRFNQIMQTQLSKLAALLKRIGMFILTPFDHMLDQLKQSWIQIEDFIASIPKRLKNLWGKVNPKNWLSDKLGPLFNWGNASVQLAPLPALAPQAAHANLNNLPMFQTSDRSKTTADKLNMTIRFMNPPTGMQVNTEPQKALTLQTHFGVW